MRSRPFETQRSVANVTYFSAFVASIFNRHTIRSGCFGATLTDDMAMARHCLLAFSFSNVKPLFQKIGYNMARCLS